MNTLIRKIVIIALLQGLSHFLFAHVILDYPQGGETFHWGETLTIQWHVYIPHSTLNWDLYFSGDGGSTWSAIQLDIPVDQLSFQWTVPDTTTSQCRIRVVQDNSAEDYWGTSMNFNTAPLMLPPTLDLPAMDTIIESDLLHQDIAIQAWLNNHGGAAITNYCANLIWTNDFNGIITGCGSSGSEVVTFTATDDCGSIVTNAILAIVDSQPPTITIPASNLVVECDGNGNTAALNNWLNHKGNAAASDAGGNVSWTNNYSNLSNGCGLTGSANVIFTATDECDNHSTTGATFTIVDSFAPFIDSSPHGITIECGTSDQEMIIQIWLMNHGGASASDICGNISWTNNYSTLIVGCDTTSIASVIFTASDECGNTTTANAVIEFQDLIPLNIIVSAMDTILECGSPNQEMVLQDWLANEGGAVASDACGNVTWTNNYSGLSIDCGATSSASVIFTATDECGNHTTTSAIFAIVDHVAPDIDVMAHDTTIECGVKNQETIIQHWLESHGGAQASDNCGNVNWTNDFPSIPEKCDTTLNLDITFTASDDCGNNSSTHATFTILETSTTSVSNISDLDVKIYPNPVSDMLYIDFDKNESLLVHLTFFDACGIPLWSYQDQANEIIIPVEKFAPGIYFLQVETTHGSFARKVIVE